MRDFKVYTKYNGPIKAPIKKGEELGELIINKNEDETLTIPLYANEDIKKVNVFKSLLMSFNYMIWGDV